MKTSSFEYRGVSKGRNTKLKIFSTLYSETENEHNLHDPSSFLTNVDILNSLKTTENQRFSTVLKGYKKGTLARNRFLKRSSFIRKMFVLRVAVELPKLAKK